jgi:acyl dehydratase
MALQRRIYYQAMQVGDEVPPWQPPPFDRVQIARYAGASGDFNRLYLDEPFAKGAGFRSVIVPGTLALGALSQMLSEWLKGPFVRKLQARFLKILWPGDVLTCRGRVSGRRREGDQYLLDLDLWIENTAGEMVVKGSGIASLFYNAQDESQRLAGGPPLLVDDPPTEPARKAAAKKSEGRQGKSGK